MSNRLRVLTLNLLTTESADGPTRHALVRRLLPDFDADVVALQEVLRPAAGTDQARDLLSATTTS